MAPRNSTQIRRPKTKKHQTADLYLSCGGIFFFCFWCFQQRTQQVDGSIMVLLVTGTLQHIVPYLIDDSLRTYLGQVLDSYRGGA